MCVLLLLNIPLGLGFRLGLRLLNCDFENNKWRHLLNILNDRIVEVFFAISAEI